MLIHVFVNTFHFELASLCVFHLILVQKNIIGLKWLHFFLTVDALTPEKFRKHDRFVLRL